MHQSSRLMEAKSEPPMPEKPRILVIGPAALCQRVQQTMTTHEVLSAPHALAGVWQAGRQPTSNNLLVSLALGEKAMRVVQTLRHLRGQARIVVSCSPTDEPRAREALEHGADDYVLEPVGVEDLRRCFQRRDGERKPTATNGAANRATSLEELHQLSEVLRNLSDGPQATLDRLAALVQRKVGAAGVAIQLDDLHAAIGDAASVVLDEPIYRQGRPVGRLQLGPRSDGSYSAATARRITDMGRFVEAAVKEARERDRLHQLAWTDDLSGLHNRRYFEHTLDQLLETALQRQSRVTVLLFDIDNFKAYNDNFGHDTGDALIRELGTLLRRCSRADDIVVRYGGDEFAVIFWDAEHPRIAGSRHPHEARALAERFQGAIADHDFECLGAHAPGPLTISGGLACFPWHGTTRETLLRAADQALLAAKRTGKGRILLAGESFETPTT